NGCEWNVLQDGACLCEPGMTRPCYQGGPNTEGTGPCVGGTQTCDVSGTSWGACVGQVLPRAEICANMIDEDCNGVVDDSEDADADGWPRCSGDCCDSLLDGCDTPALVNPGAYEFVGNGVDDDCDAATSETMPPPPCSTVAKYTGVSSLDVAQAIGLCQTTTLNPPLPQRKWGLTYAGILFPDGTNPTLGQMVTILNRQLAVLTDYGTGGIVPREGATMLGLSTGYMRDTGDPNCPAEPDTNNNLTSFPPASYLAAHGGVLPGSNGCNSACPSGTGANDATNIRYRIRVPTNAKSFSYQFKFVSYEYWMYSCQTYNDYFLALLQTTAPGIPADKNISFDELMNPVSVNNGFFDVCKPKGCYTCPAGYTELAGTGMEQQNFGGGTKWLTTEAPVIPGETIQVEFMIFDVSDNWLDSVVLIDNFKWGQSTAVVNTHD
ncbi:MAG TPA: choice-of-anchor L domain-containing protein, partial [Polyangium sp.]|nr:choice-of-anchor L domain-containing protein [Polyangium sp.]